MAVTHPRDGGRAKIGVRDRQAEADAGRYAGGAGRETNGGGLRRRDIDRRTGADHAAVQFGSCAAGI